MVKIFTRKGERVALATSALLFYSIAIWLSFSTLTMTSYYQVEQSDTDGKEPMYYYNLHTPFFYLLPEQPEVISLNLLFHKKEFHKSDTATILRYKKERFFIKKEQYSNKITFFPTPFQKMDIIYPFHDFL